MTIRVRKVYIPSTSRAREQGEISWTAVAGQTTSVVTSDWQRVGIGCNMVLSVVASALSGTLDVEIETAATNETTPATLRTIDSFDTMNAAGTKRMSFAATDEYVRFKATPGVGGGQTASYTVSGSFVPVS